MSNQEITTVTATELYNLSNTPKFIKQTPVNNNGDYNMFWKIDNKTYKTNNNLFN